MATVTPIQSNFTAGEISPRMRGRVEADFYRAALAQCRNFVPSPQGSVRMRPGARFGLSIRDYSTPEIGDPVDITSVELLKAIPVAGREGYLAAFGDLCVDVISADAVAASAGQNLTADSEIFSGDNWDFDQQDGWDCGGGSGHVPTFGVATVVAGSPSTAVQLGYANNVGDWIGQSFTIANPGTYQLRFTFPAFHPNGLGDVHWPGIGNNTTVRVRIGSDIDHAEYYELTESGPTTNDSNASYCVNVVLPAGTHYFSVAITTVSGSAAVTGVSLQYFSRNNIVTPWATSKLGGLYATPLVQSHKHGLVICHESTKPYVLQIDEFGDWSCAAAAFVNQPTEWGPGNYPRVALMFQGRLWMGSTPAQPDKFWASTSTNYLDFGLGSGTATDGLAYQLNVKQQIRWMAGYQGSLVMGTDAGEFVINSQAGVICTTDIQGRFESGFGSAAKAPLLVGSQALYVSSDRRKLRALNFEQQREAWLSQDVTFRAEHVTSSLIDEVAFARDPDCQLAVLLDTGTLACATYAPEAGVVGWWTLDSTLHIESIATTEGASSKLWLLDSNHDLHFLTFGDASEYCADAWVTRDINAQNVTGLTHLVGQTVWVIATQLVAGAMGLPVSRVVGSNGALTTALPGLVGTTGDAVIVGLPFTGQLQTLPTEGISNRGTAQGAKRRWPKVRLRLNDSYPPTVNGERPAGDVSSTTLRLTDDLTANTLGHDDGHLHIEQLQPLRTEILAIFGVHSGSEV